MTAGTFLFYNNAPYLFGNGINLIADDLKMLLCSSAYTPDLNHQNILDITNEISGGGYVRQSLSNKSFVVNNGIATFSCDPVVFSAVGGSWTAQYWVLIDSSLPNEPLIAYGLINSNGDAVPISDGNQLTINNSGNGLFRVERING